MRGRILIAIALLCAAGIAWNYFRPIPVIAASISLPAQTTIAGTPPLLPWPAVGSAALGVSGLGALGYSGDDQPVPMASVAKVMTALVILDDKPLKLGEQGPTITITDQDVQTYQTDKAQQQSVVEVQAGESLTEFQALEGLLIPSGNNLAETLARWDATTVPAFVVKMNQKAKKLGLTNTKFDDPAGVSPQTIGTARELMALGIAAMKEPALAQIVRMPQAQLPVAGRVYNVNAALGQAGIVGIKTGSGLNLGANFLFAAQIIVKNFTLTIYGCVMGQPTLAIAFSTAKALVTAISSVLTVKKEITKNQRVGSYVTPWGPSADLIATYDVDLVEWPGMILRHRLDAPALYIEKPQSAGVAAGSLHLVLGDYKIDVPLVTDSGLYPPGRLWRVTRLPWTNS
jgi:D-alanyl-D-alanine carboxypeptidase (penicillin-binding protein 5/6)